MLRAVLAGSHDISLRVIPTKYPSGGAKQLTQILTGKQVPHGGRSSDIGVLMQNVGTAYAVKRAVIDGEPLTERVVTLTGEAVSRPGNVWARLGTPVRHLLEQAEFCPASDQMVIMGGPLMGFTLPGLDVPVVKITNCLLAPSASEMGEPQEEKGCIRCSACADACPADLLPQQLYWFSKGQQHDKATAHNLADCIECGACAWVCPSNIPLVQYFRQEKAEIAAIRQEEQRAAEAKARFEARQARLEREKAARAERHKKAAVQPAAKDQDAINAALARVRDKQRDAAQPIVIQAGAMGKGGDVFVLDMGDSVKIIDLAKQMIRLSGLEVKDSGHPEGDIEIQVTGLRPGEKLYEELLIGDEVQKTTHPRIMTANEVMLSWDVLSDIITRMDEACRQSDQLTLRRLLLEAPTGFAPKDDICDLVWQQNHQAV